MRNGFDLDFPTIPSYAGVSHRRTSWLVGEKKTIQDPPILGVMATACAQFVQEVHALITPNFPSGSN